MIDFTQNSIFIDGKEFDVTFEVSKKGARGFWFSCDLANIQNIKIKDYPQGLNALIDLSSNKPSIPLFEVMTLWVKRTESDIELDFYHDLDYDFLPPIKWSYEGYANAFNEQAKKYEGVRTYIEKSDEAEKFRHFVFTYSNPNAMTIGTCFVEALSDLKVINQITEIHLAGGIFWKKEYEQSESMFCTEVISPLLRKIGFSTIRYNHGTREYGKDFVFSEATKFGDLRHYGLQAKAGNIRGNVNSEVDEIIGQIEDAFTMPYYLLGSKTPCYISTFIIVISGKFTKNAQEKILQKIPPNRLGSIYFFDKEKVLELIEIYWNKIAP